MYYVFAYCYKKKFRNNKVEINIVTYRGWMKLR